MVKIQDFYNGIDVENLCQTGAIYDQVTASIALLNDNEQKIQALLDKMLIYVEAAKQQHETEALTQQNGVFNPAEALLWTLLHNLGDRLMELSPAQQEVQAEMRMMRAARTSAASADGNFSYAPPEPLTFDSKLSRPFFRLVRNATTSAGRRRLMQNNPSEFQLALVHISAAIAGVFGFLQLLQGPVCFLLGAFAEHLPSSSVLSCYHHQGCKVSSRCQ